jgi:tetratricopeptide (TPR) repeat protein
VQSEAEPGVVLVDETTKAASQAAIAYTHAGEHTVKGKSEPLVLWRAMRVVAGAGGSQRVDGLEAAFVGRARELALVKELFHAAAEGNRARLVLVAGAAGVGKSRLGWEFRKYIEGLVSTVLWHQGRCPPYGEGVAFWALAEMVRQRFGIAEDDPAEAAGERLAEGLETWVPDPDERRFVLPRLAQLIGASDAELSREELFAGWRLFFERMSSTNPVVLLVEDLQWADAGLLDFLEYLLEWSADHPIFVMAFARPELAERLPGWLSDRRNATAIHLEPLPTHVIEDMLDDLVPGMPGEAKSRIGARAEGVPLFAVETIRALVDRDVVVPKEGVYRLVGDIGDLQVPASLTSLLAARLDNLPGAERDLVKALAVLGATFSRQAVSAVTSAPDQVDDLLRSLVRKEILSVRSDPLSPERGQYAFTQAMLRSVAYDTLTKRERKARHLAVAEHLRRTFPDDGDEIAEVLASHYDNAYSAAPTDPDADAIRQQAVTAYARAGRRASGVGAPDSAEQAYRKAANLATGDEERLGLTERAADMAMQAGSLEDAVELYDQVRKDRTSRGSTAEAARVAAPMARCLTRLGRAHRAVEILQEALSSLGDDASGATLASLHDRMGMSLVSMGERQQALPHLERAITLATALDLPEVLGRSLVQKGVVLAYEARVVEGVALLQAAADLAHARGFPDVEMEALGDIDYVRFFYDLGAQGEASEAALRHARRVGNARAQAHHLGNLAWIHLYSGQWERAQEELDESLEIVTDEHQRAANRIVLVLLASYRGDHEEARRQTSDMSVLRISDNKEVNWFLDLAEAVVACCEERFADALAITAPMVRDAVASQGMVSDAVRVGWPLAVEAASAAGQWDEAEQLISLVGDAPIGHVPPFLRSQLARYRAGLTAQRGDGEGVGESFRRAVEIVRALDYPYWLASTEADYARWLASQGKRDEAEALFVRASAVLRDLGAQRAVDSIEADLSTITVDASSTRGT